MPADILGSADLKWIQGSRCVSNSGLRGRHRPQVEKPARLEGQEGAGGSPGEMALAKVTSDEERGKLGQAKMRAPKQICCLQVVTWTCCV